MFKASLWKEKPDGINKETLFAIMAKLNIQQRAILSLRFIENMSLEQVSYILNMGYLWVIWHLLNARIRLKLLLIINGYHAITLKQFMIVFGQVTSI